MNDPVFFSSCYAAKGREFAQFNAGANHAEQILRTFAELARIQVERGAVAFNGEPAAVFFSTSFVNYDGRRGNWNAPNLPTFSAWGCDSLDVLALRESNLFKAGASPNSFFR